MYTFYRIVILRIAIAAALIAVFPGCLAVRYLDYLQPGLRLDRARNEPLPAAGTPDVENALRAWRDATPRERTQYPTPYHQYVETPAAGTFEGDRTIGLAFSGGGTRGTVFAAMCVQEIGALGEIVVATPGGDVRIDLLEDVDYVSGVSTGAIPAAAFALAMGDRALPGMGFGDWPHCFNRDIVSAALANLAIRPDRIARDFLFEANTRPVLCGVIAGAFFGGNAHRPYSGLTFGDLPATPVVLIGATIINDPGVPLVQTRLPYRFALDQKHAHPWQTGVQSFESFRTDPMTYPLGEACYNSLSYPGHMRSGLMRVQPYRSWVEPGIDEASRTRIENAMHQPGYQGTYEIKDGGLVDNRGIYVIERLFNRMADVSPPPRKPLIVSLDAGFLAFRQTQSGSNGLKKGWMREVTDSSRTNWQTGQTAYNLYVDQRTAQQEAFSLVRMRLGDVLEHGTGPGAPRQAPRLEALCRSYPSIGDTATLVERLRGIGTTLDDLSASEMDAIQIAARVAVADQRDAFLAWASELYGGASAAFFSPPE